MNGKSDSQNSQFQHLVKESPSVLFSFKPDEFEINFISENIQGILGYEPKEFINHPQYWFDCVHPDDLPYLISILPNLLEKGSIATEYRFKNKNGEFRWLYDEKRVIYDKNGKPLEIIGSWMDITERKRLEQKLKESELKYRSLVETSPNAVLLLDLKSNVLECNKAAERNLSKDRSQIINKNIFTFLSTSKKKMISLTKEFLKNIKDGSFMPLEIEYLNKYREKKWYKLHYSLINLKNKTFIIFEIIDISNTKKMEEIIKEENRKLKESEVKYREAYEIADFYKDLFAHDINNILSNISSSSQLCAMYLKEPENQNKIEELMKIINEEVTRGASLISNVRTLTELEESRIPIQPIELSQFLNDSIASIKSIFQDRNINIQVDSFFKKIYVQANDLLKEIFGNILDNAVKYNNNPVVDIFIKISKEQKEGQDYIKMEFIDNGIGITATQKEFIFQKGFKKHIGGKGMGFGLALVKKIIEYYKGHIWVEDKVPGDYSKGSNFVILIPEVIQKHKKT